MEPLQSGEISGEQFAHFAALLVNQVEGAAIFFIDQAGRIASWNPGVQNLLGFSASEWVGKPGSIIFTPEDLAAGEYEKELTESAERGCAMDVRWHLKRDRSRIFVNGVMQAVRDEQGNLLGFGKIIRDATQQQLSAEQLRTSKDQFRLLAQAVERLTEAETRDDVLRILHETARRVTSADAISVVLREGEQCHYAAEDSPEPLWAGQRFPIVKCVSGSAMVGNATVIVADVLNDPRIARELYEPKFVRSLISVPIGGTTPFAAVSAYWRLPHEPGAEEIALLETLARAGGSALKRREAEHDLRSSEARFRAAYDRAPLGIMLSSPEGLITGSNEAVQELIGYTAHELLGRDLLSLIHPDDIHRCQEAQNALISGAIPSYTIEKRYVCKEKRPVWVRATASVHRNSEGQPQEIINLIENIEDRRAAESERERLLSELARSNDELSNFAHIAAHDLQAPLRMVKSYTVLLERRLAGMLDNTTREFMRTVQEGATRMEELIQALLHYAQVGQDAAQQRTVPLEAAVSGALSNLEPILAEVKADVHYDELPSVCGDSAQLLQLMQNLIGNAIKYRRTDVPLKIRIAARRSSDQWVVSVEDNGQGIPPQHWQTVFAPFRRLHGSDVPGTGMGLAVCRKIVERHRGQIWVNSVPGKGATFSFTIPASD